MATFTEQQVLELIKGHDALQELAQERFWLLFKNDIPWQTQSNHWRDIEYEEEDDDIVDSTNWRYTPGIDEVQFEQDTVLISCSAPACSRGCCGTQRATYKFPLSYLWTAEQTLRQDIEARHEAARRTAAEKKRLKVEQERLNHEEWVREQEEQDRQEYERLAAKYGDKQ